MYTLFYPINRKKVLVKMSKPYTVFFGFGVCEAKMQPLTHSYATDNEYVSYNKSRRKKRATAAFGMRCR